MVFDKTGFFKFKISNNSKQNIDETTKNLYQPMDFENLKKKSPQNKSLQILVKFLRLPKKYPRVWVSKPIGFLFFVISISG